MATLVLNTVGTILGGPIGGAIGSLVGQSIDQQLFGPGTRHGPRLGDLSLQTSSYGSAIPQVFGSMRVAGTVVWASDLQEKAATQSAKGQPDTVTYSYSVSLAVALSSRAVMGIGRIWADGKLIRDANGRFSVATDFRIHDGSEEQPVDPLIASIEGIDSTPAYRGLALAVFENLQLADFGNRIPFLTFEVIADPDSVTIDTILATVSDGIIASNSSGSVTGYAAYGSTLKAAVQPLVDLWNVPLFDDGFSLSSGGMAPVPISDDETGCTAERKPAPRSERSQVSATSLPSAGTLSYYDRERDYQTGLARASLDGMPRLTEQLELPAVLDASAAKALVETSLARRWAERDRLTLRLPPTHMGIRPGAFLMAPADTTIWQVDRATVDGLAVLVELRPTYNAAVPAPADPGRVAPSIAAVPEPTNVAIVELPDDGTGSLAAPAVFIAAASEAATWRAVPLSIDVGAVSYISRSAGAPTLKGQALGGLGDGQSAVLDLMNSVEVQLERGGDWLESRDDDALAAGENLALLGSELIQFGLVTPLGAARFRLSRLLRGRRGTEWAMGLHSVGDIFVMLDTSRLQRVQLSAAEAGATVKVTPGGLADGEAKGIQAVIAGEAMRPPSPVRLRATRDALGTLRCSWVRRSSRGWSWLDNVDAPLVCSAELYQVKLRGPAATIERTSSEPMLDFTADEVAAIGIGAAELSVAQVGDLAASRPVTLAITIN